MFAAASKTASSSAPSYIEDVFSTYLYTGNGSSQTITNGVDLAGKGGMVWIKNRSNGANDHVLFSTANGVNQGLSPNTTGVLTNHGNSLTAFNSNGFTLGSTGSFGIGSNGFNNATWTFRKQEKFFDIVTYTGDGTGNRQISHLLGSTPGCIIVKGLTNTGSWTVYHRSLGATKYMLLNYTNAESVNSFMWDNTAPTSTNFTVGASAFVNESGVNYVAYLFAHDAGGFGLSGTDNVISCGSFTTNSAGEATVNLGYEPQYVLWKITDTTGSWGIKDSMRGIYVDPAPNESPVLFANTSSAESLSASIQLTSTGFRTNLSAQVRTYIYIAIRRGPMKVPTDATKVFSPIARTGTGGVSTVTHGFTVDAWIASDRDNSSNLVGYKQAWFDRLLGNANGFITSNSNAWGGGWGDAYFTFTNNTGVNLTAASGTGEVSFLNKSGTPYVYWGLQRAPNFFDEVCYTGNGSSQNISHNLGAVPEMMIVKNRGTSGAWAVYTAPTGNTNELVLNLTDNLSGTSAWNSTTPTSTVFSVGLSNRVNGTANTYIAYLFASCPGVSKVGSYTGTGATLTISCGFAARFVLIKRTDSTGNWWVWDTARGMVAGTDPRLAFNVIDAESNANWVYTDASGFQIVTTDATVNASGGTYIFLAIA